MSAAAHARAAARSETASLAARYGAVALGVLAGFEWLLGRTVSRLAAAPNLEGTPRAIIEGVGRVGIALLPPALLVAFALLLWFALRYGAHAVKERDSVALTVALMLCVFLGMVAGSIVLPNLTWLSITFNIVSALTLLALTLTFLIRSQASSLYKSAITLSYIGYMGWYSFALQGDLPATGNASGGALLVLNAGEVALVTVPYLLFWTLCVPYRQWLRPARWVLPVVITALFSAAAMVDMLVNQGFMGVFSLWSVGYTLFLPWPLYALALGVFVYTVLTCFTTRGEKVQMANPNTGLALLLVLYAGYNLQLSYQHLLAMLALALLTGVAYPFPLSRVPPDRVTT